MFGESKKGREDGVGGLAVSNMGSGVVVGIFGGPKKAGGVVV